MKLIIMDTAVSLAPSSWLQYPKIKRYNDKNGHLPLVDGSKHQHYLQSIPLEQRKDRPDILHFALLTTLGYRSFFDDLEVYFDLQDAWYKINQETNLPRDQSRFYGLLTQLLTTETTNPFIRPVTSFTPSFDQSIIFSSHGRQLQSEDLMTSSYIFGGFAHGELLVPSSSEENVVKLANTSLDLWTAISRFINLYLDFHQYKNHKK